MHNIFRGGMGRRRVGLWCDPRGVDISVFIGNSLVSSVEKLILLGKENL